MPIYEYTCSDCGAEFEKFVRSITGVAEVSCPVCGGTHLKKGWSVFGTGKSDGSSSAMAASTAGSCSPAGT
jgi:putative FmdB family regulatory protein